jgi:hypothetical protein
MFFVKYFNFETIKNLLKHFLTFDFSFNLTIFLQQLK